MVAPVSPSMSVSSTAPATPTNPPAAVSTMCRISSLDSACTTTPCSVCVVKPGLLGSVTMLPTPSLTPVGLYRLVASASTCAPSPTLASVVLAMSSTPTAPPTPTKPTATAPDSSNTSVSSRAATSTSPPADTVALAPIVAVVVLAMVSTSTTAPMPTPPAATPMPSMTTSSWPVACTSTSRDASTTAPSPIEAPVVLPTMLTPATGVNATMPALSPAATAR